MDSLQNKKEAPFGTWVSPISAEMTVQVKSARNCDIKIAGGGFFWTEPRPEEKGRTVIMHLKGDGTVQTLTPPGYDVRSKVHEYGGVSYTVVGNSLYFVHAKDQRLYRQDLGGDPFPLTAEGVRFAEFIPVTGGLIAIAEIHAGIDDSKKTDNFLVFIDTKTGHWKVLDKGHDFYASPTISPDGKRLAWITWNHPNMPWDGNLLWTATFFNGELENKRMVAGGSEEAIWQPQWSPLGNLFFVSDKEGWWNFYRHYETFSENICPMEAEFGRPLWRLGYSSWCFTGRNEEILCSYDENGRGKLGLLEPGVKKLQPLFFEFTDYAQLTSSDGQVLFLAGSPQLPRRIVKLDLHTLTLSTVGEAPRQGIDSEAMSVPQSIQFPSARGRIAYGYYYPPQNKHYAGLKNTLPPLMIMSHGGPTGCADSVFNLRIQYWTSRGFAVVDVDYGGSTGYGRKYRESLKGQWGIMDVEDCIHAGMYLAEKGYIDPKKIVIRGGSAGGYTTLQALVHSKVFAAGASYYGVSDLELLIRDTHKFEANYLDSLIGPYPERQDLYLERSPIHYAEKISCPVIFFQGGKDKVVPLNQTQKMYEALQKQGIKSKLVIYENEEHGFRQIESIKDSLEQELQFYLEAFELCSNT
jgi:dipeptidyl aminopeptidase/acylaminoacyl peptidase